MSARASLRGVRCIQCAQKGHSCQAQMWMERKPLCLRCADGEPCCWETAQRMETPAWRREPEDMFGVAAPRRVPCMSRSVKVQPPLLDRREIVQLRGELEHASAERVAFRHGLDAAVVAEFQARDEARRPGREKWLREQEAKLGAEGEARRPARGQECRPETMAGVQAVVAAHFGLSREDLVGASQAAYIVAPRQIAMYLIRSGSRWVSLQSIAAAFGGRHHTTIVYSIKTVAGRIKLDKGLEATVEALRAKLRPAGPRW